MQKLEKISLFPNILLNFDDSYSNVVQKGCEENAAIPKFKVKF